MSHACGSKQCAEGHGFWRAPSVVNLLLQHTPQEAFCVPWRCCRPGCSALVQDAAVGCRGQPCSSSRPPGSESWPHPWLTVPLGPCLSFLNCKWDHTFSLPPVKPFHTGPGRWPVWGLGSAHCRLSPTCSAASRCFNLNPVAPHRQ